MAAARMQSDSDKKPKFNVVDKIPAFGIVGAKRNRNLIKIQQDLVERTRNNEKMKAGPVVEVLYIDPTRNVGVVLGKFINVFS